MKWYLVVLPMLVLGACAQQPPAAPVVPAGPPSLQLVPADYYSSTLRYKARHRHRGRVVTRTYDIPVQVNRATGEVKVEKRRRSAPEKESAEDSQDIAKQMDAVQDRVGRIQRRIQKHKKSLVKEDDNEASVEAGDED
jgi:hypothetical protein